MSNEATEPAPEVTPTTEEETPLPRIVIEDGNVTAEEIATMLVLFAAAAGPGESTDRRQQGGWTRKSRTFNAGAVRGAGWGGGL